MEIYLAAAENGFAFRVLNWMRYPYRLCSYYSIVKAGALKDGKRKRPDEMLESAQDGSKWIMDSGLFSFMFGAEKGKLTTYDDFRSYALRYVETMHAWDWKHCIVECDTQRLLGVEDTYKLREDVFDKCGFEVMYVWHEPCGVGALDTAQYTERDRIALSVPEIRQLLGSATTGGVKTKQALIHLLSKCYGKGPKVHLLGNTEAALLKLRADSCDSSSWIYAVTYGKGTIFTNGRVRQISIHSPKWKAWMDWVATVEPEAWKLAGESSDVDMYQRVLASAKSYQMMINYTHGDDPWQLQ